MDKIKITLASLALLLAATGAKAQSYDEVAETYNQAVEKFQAKALTEALPLFESIVSMGKTSEDPEVPELVTNAKNVLPQIYFQVGGSFANKKDWDQASQYFAKALTAAEEVQNAQIMTMAKQWVANSYVALGTAAFNGKDFEKAVEVFSKGYEINPGDPKLATLLAMSYGELDNYDKAYEIYDGVIALEQHGAKYAKETADAREKMSSLLLRQGNAMAQARENAPAIAALERAVEVNPANSLAYLLLIQTANNAKNYDKVIAWGDKAAEAQADATQKSNTYFLLGAAYENKGNNAKAIESYRKVTAGPNAATAKAQIQVLNE